jgi:DNA-binding NarL/FixJ family response regulator
MSEQAPPSDPGFDFGAAGPIAETVAGLVSDGMNIAEVAEGLGMSRAEVRRHLANLFKANGLTS